jgi:hypothetical protein
MREESVEALFFVDHVGLSIKHHRVPVESDPDLAGGCLGSVPGRHAETRGSGTSNDSSFYVRIHI